MENKNMTRMDDPNYSTTYAVPVTLRQVEEMGIPLDSAMGVDETEHAELLDDKNIMRIVFGVMIDGLDISEIVSLKCLNASLLNPEPYWNDCIARVHHASGSRMGTENDRRKNLVWKLLDEIAPDYQSTIDDARKPYDDYVAEYRRDNPEEFDEE